MKGERQGDGSYGVGVTMKELKMRHLRRVRWVRAKDLGERKMRHLRRDVVEEGLELEGSVEERMEYEKEGEGQHGGGREERMEPRSGR